MMIRHICIIFVLCLLLSQHTSHTSSAFCVADVIMGHGRREVDSQRNKMGKKRGCRGNKRSANTGKNRNSKSGPPCSESNEKESPDPPPPDPPPPAPTYEKKSSKPSLSVDWILPAARPFQAFNNKWKLSGIHLIYYENLVKTLGGYGTLPGKLIWPTSVTTAPEGDLVVKDSGTGHIVIYSPEGRFKQRFAYGFEPIKGLGDVTCMRSGVILVTNGTRIIQLFSKDGELIHELKSPKLTWPYSYGITVMQGNKIAVSDWSDGGKINIIAMDWRMNAILKTNAIEGFHRPVRIAVSKNEELLVTEGQLFGRFKGCCIKVIDKNKHLKKTVGPRYGNTYEFENPSGISVDTFGNIFVVDEQKNCVVMFSPDTSLSAVLVSEGLQGPSGVAVMEHGLIAVADCYNHCVKMFKYR